MKELDKILSQHFNDGKLNSLLKEHTELIRQIREEVKKINWLTLGGRKNKKTWMIKNDKE